MRARMFLLVALTLATTTAVAGCSKKKAGAGDPGFDERWAWLAQQGSQPLYIQDDRGKGLMDSVLLAQQGALQMAPALAQSYKGGANLPEKPDADQVQKTIRQYLPGVKACYLRLARGGDGRSGKAIVSFQI